MSLFINSFLLSMQDSTVACAVAYNLLHAKTVLQCQEDYINQPPNFHINKAVSEVYIYWEEILAGCVQYYLGMLISV
jgi:hypothetical protein